MSVLMFRNILMTENMHILEEKISEKRESLFYLSWLKPLEYNFLWRNICLTQEK